MTEAAFTSHLSRIEKKLFISALSVTKNTEDAKDAVGNAILLAWKHLNKLGDDGKFDAWMVSITVNEAKKIRSASRMYVDIDDIEDAFADSASYDDMEFFDTLARARLDKRTRKIITLYFFYGYSLEEISDMIGFPISTVKSSYYRGLRKIADAEGIDEKKIRL